MIKKTYRKSVRTIEKPATIKIFFYSLFQIISFFFLFIQKAEPTITKTDKTAKTENILVITVLTVWPLSEVFFRDSSGNPEITPATVAISSFKEDAVVEAAANRISPGGVGDFITDIVDGEEDGFNVGGEVGLVVGFGVGVGVGVDAEADVGVGLGVGICNGELLG